jgi:NTE family protein
LSKTSLLGTPTALLRQALQSTGINNLIDLGGERSPLASAKSYADWKKYALADDEATGMAAWREAEKTRLYDFSAIRKRHDRLRKMLAEHDDHGLLFALNEGVHGNMGGMGNAALYQRAKFGTKVLVSNYIDAICEGLQHLAECDEGEVSEAEKADFFTRAQLCFGRSALLLSGGGIYGNFHVGVVKVLEEQDLLPSVISGSSAGSLIAAIVGTHTRKELDRVLHERHLQIETERVSRTLQDALKGMIPRFDVHQIAMHIERLVPDLTFAEALERSGIHINISVSPAEVHQMPRLLNAVTSPNVYVRSAVLASCSVPGVFPPAMLVAKNRYGEPQPYLPNRRWYDGSMSDDIPAKRLSRLYGVNHFIVSQVNPFALALTRPYSAQLAPYSAWIQLCRQSTLGAASAMQKIFSRRGPRWSRFNFALNGFVSVLAQEYKGDINILPDLGMVKPWRGMASPTEAQLREIIHAGERATWPKVEMIRNCTKIGRLLDAIVQEREGRDISGHHVPTRGQRAINNKQARKTTGKQSGKSTKPSVLKLVEVSDPIAEAKRA